MTDVVERETTPREVERKAPAPPRPLVRWIEMLVFLGFAGIAGVAIWLLAGPTGVDDGSFQLAEDMRFERIASQPVTVGQFGQMEDMIGPSLDRSFDFAELSHFYRIGGLEPPMTIEEFAELEGAVTYPLASQMQLMANVYEGDYFGYLPTNYYLLRELAGIYEGDYFGYLPMDYWQMP